MAASGSGATRTPRPSRFWQSRADGENEIGVPVVAGSYRVHVRAQRDRRHRRVFGQRAAPAGDRYWPGKRRGKARAAPGQGEHYRGSRRAMGPAPFPPLPEMPIQNACVARWTTGEKPGLPPHFRPAAGDGGGRWLVNRRAIRRQRQRLINASNSAAVAGCAALQTCRGGNIQGRCGRNWAETV